MKTKLHIGIAEYRKLSDEELIYRYNSRHEYKTMHVLYERYGHLIYGLCMEYTKEADAARSLTEKLFITLLSDVKRFHIPVFKPWLLKYVKNYCFGQVTTLMQLDEMTDMEEVTEKDINPDEVEDILERAVNELDALERRCLDMFYLNDMTHAAIAQATGQPVKQIKQLLQSAKQHLKIKLGALSYVKNEQAV